MLHNSINLDISKAFDTIQHDILLNKLYNSGIRGFMHRWFKEYLPDRHQFTVVNGKLSKQQLVKTGVPQGSSLGPLLFMIYINDIQYLFAETDHYIRICGRDRKSTRLNSSHR